MWFLEWNLPQLSVQRRTPGQVAAEKMKALEAQDYCLNSYISSFVRNSYARKW